MSHSKISTFTLITLSGLTGGIERQSSAGSAAHARPNDGSIAYITARLLEEFHYTQHPFDTEMSHRFYALI